MPDYSWRSNAIPTYLNRILIDKRCIVGLIRKIEKFKQYCKLYYSNLNQEFSIYITKKMSLTVMLIYQNGVMEVYILIARLCPGLHGISNEQHYLRCMRLV